MKINYLIFCFFLVLTPMVICHGEDDFSKDILDALSRAMTEESIQNLESNYDASYQESLAKGIYPKVQTNEGLLSGIDLPEAHAFYSVPFAKPPIGSLRFMPPVPADNYGEFNASVIDHLACYQMYQQNCSQGLCFNNINEDCLVLNIHVPINVNLSDSTSPPRNRLPVIYWIHGGGLLNGAGTSPIYDGRYLSNVANAIVITSNYRLGAFGFLVFDEGDDLISGNQGLADQQLVLQWIQDNVDKFGGDTNRVTIVGNSAGAQSVMFHLMSTKSSSLFHNAVMQSLPALFKYPDLATAIEVTQKAFNFTNCSDVTCLRNVPAKTLVTIANKIRAQSILAADLYTAIEPFGLVLDGEEFIYDPIQYFENGGWHGNEKNVIMGTNIDEMAFISAYIPIHMTEGMFRGFLVFVFGDLGTTLADEYIRLAESESTKPGRIDYRTVLDQVATDGFFICPVRALARLSSAAAKSTKVYLYSFAHAMDDPSCEKAWKPSSICGKVFHSAENVFVFRSAPLLTYNFSSNDVYSLDQFTYYWGNFAYSGNPSSGHVSSIENVIEWPSYSHDMDKMRLTEQLPWITIQHLLSRAEVATSANIVIDSPSGQIDQNYKKDICDFWDNTGYYLTLKNSTTTAPDVIDVTGELITATVATTQLTDDKQTTTGGAMTSYKLSSCVYIMTSLSMMASLFSF